MNIVDRFKKHYGVTPRPFPDRNSKHFLSLHTDPIPANHRVAKGKPGSNKPSTQHDRVIAFRAGKMRIGIEEYKRRFCK